MTGHRRAADAAATVPEEQPAGPVGTAPARPRTVRGDVVDLTVDGMTVDGSRRVLLGGCLVDLASRDRTLRILQGHLGRPPGSGTLLVASANLDHVTHFGNRPAGDELDPGRMDDWLVLLDGHPLVVAARRLTGLEYPRLAGADLLPVLLDLAEGDGRPVAFLGGRPSVREPLAAALEERWPRLRVAGHWTPERAVLLDPEASQRLAAEIALTEPRLLVVGLGKPLQERWLARYGRYTGAQVAVAFGAAIDFTAGTVPRAPMWLQERGLEWTYRLTREPRRMARRYLVQGPVALRRLVLATAVLGEPAAARAVRPRDRAAEGAHG